MTKQELAHMARLMYDLQEYCTYVWQEVDEGCPKCVAKKNGCDLFAPCHGVPHMWGITLTDIERLKRIEGELRVKVPVEWLKSAVQANKEWERGEYDK